MQIVNIDQFLALPAGTAFMKYKPCVFEALQFKGETLGRDFGASSIDDIECDNSSDLAEKLEIAEISGSSVHLDLSQNRDGSLDETQLFAILEDDDIRAIIEKLQSAILS